MQNFNQNPNNNQNSPLQLESKQVYSIDVSIELEDCIEFVEWLKSKGHCARVVDSECSFVDGVIAGEVYKSLRAEFKGAKK